jgi:AhpD family alkylhydroperoxidase
MRLDDSPELNDGFVGFYRRVFTDGALDKKTKEMLAVAFSYGNGCPPCIKSHEAKARRLGMTDAEYRELIAVCEVIAAGGVRERFVESRD